ncbi:MAG: glycoside hydrolase family 19 protein [Polaribacter sp.]
MKKAFPNATDDKLEKIASAIDDLAKDFGIDTKEKLQHFLTQAGHESNNFNDLEENLNYRLAKLGVDYWTKYFNPQSDPTKNPNKENPNDYKKSSTSTSLFVDNEKFANHVYADKNRSTKGKLGNTSKGDGYKYRGRGIFQLTGKSNYQSFTTFYQGKYDATKNFVTNPGLLESDMKIAITSALWFYKNNVLDKLTVDKDVTVKAVTKKVNGGTNGLADRKEIFEDVKKEIDCK